LRGLARYFNLDHQTVRSGLVNAGVKIRRR
jgi:phage shock protein PspC (stress-responsive transcriptional regulator)